MPPRKGKGKAELQPDEPSSQEQQGTTAAAGSSDDSKKRWCRQRGCPHPTPLANAYSRDRHEQSEHEQKGEHLILVCDNDGCGAPFSTREAIKEHDKYAHSRRRSPNICRVCGKDLGSNSGRKVHELTRHREEIANWLANPGDIAMGVPGTSEQPWECPFQDDVSCSNYRSRHGLSKHTDFQHQGRIGGPSGFFCRHYNCIEICSDGLEQQTHELSTHVDGQPEESAYVAEERKAILCRCGDCPIDKEYKSTAARKKHEDEKHPYAARQYCDADEHCPLFFSTTGYRDHHRQVAHPNWDGEMHRYVASAVGAAARKKKTAPPAGDPNLQALAQSTQAMSVQSTTATASAGPSHSHGYGSQSFGSGGSSSTAGMPYPSQQQGRRTPSPSTGDRRHRSDSPDTRIQDDPRRRPPPK